MVFNGYFNPGSSECRDEKRTERNWAVHRTIIHIVAVNAAMKSGLKAMTSMSGVGSGTSSSECRDEKRTESILLTKIKVVIMSSSECRDEKRTERFGELLMVNCR